MAEVCEKITNRCEHGKSKRCCKECTPSAYCEHNHVKKICVECGGSQICQHKKVRKYCCDCGGSQMCEHKREKSKCIDCKGSQICIHLKRRRQCRECGGSAFCSHNIYKEQCKECGGSIFCEHNRRKVYCKDCGGSGLCEHNRRNTQCKECNGSLFCEHKQRKHLCKPCGGKYVCKSSWCETIVMNNREKYEGYCLRCFVNLFPDKPNTRNYKTKEKCVVDYITKSFPQFTWVADKKVQDGCSNRRPDLLLDLGSHIIIVEVDENKHTDYDCSCEHKRLMELSQDLQHRPIVFIRFNPDDYTNQDNVLVKSCWKVNKLGVMQIMKTKETEWKERMLCLKQQIQYWVKHPTEKTVEIVELFY